MSFKIQQCCASKYKINGELRHEEFLVWYVWPLSWTIAWKFIYGHLVKKMVLFQKGNQSILPLLDTLWFAFCIRNSKSQWAYNAGAAINCVFHLPKNFFQIFCNHTTATGVALIHSRKKIFNQPPKGDFLHEYSLQN